MRLSHTLWDDDWPEEEHESTAPILRFNPTAWAKLLYLRDKSGNEVGGFGITDAADLLFVQDFVTVEQFARVWLHTHPGDSPTPSATDEETFKRVFGSCQWAIMAIVAQDSSTYARLSFNIGPGGQILIPAEVDYSQDFGPSDRLGWDAEYAAHTRAIDWFGQLRPIDPQPVDTAPLPGTSDIPHDFVRELEKLGPAERRLILDELAERPELWDNEQEVLVL